MRTRPSGETTMPRQTSTKMLADSRKNQSKVEVMAGRSQPKKSAAGPGSASARKTKATMVRPEIMKTGLWISRPNGPNLL